MTLADLSAHLFPNVKDKAGAEERVGGAQAARESCAINQRRVLINMTQKSAVAWGVLSRPGVTTNL